MTIPILALGSSMRARAIAVSRFSAFRHSTLTILLIATLAASVSCRSVMCDDHELIRVASPDGQHVASVRQVNCGATTSLVTDLHIGSVDDVRRGRAPSVLDLSDEGRLFVTVSWTSNRHVLVRCLECTTAPRLMRTGDFLIELRHMKCEDGPDDVVMPES
jgi:hypothetical protein